MTRELTHERCAHRCCCDSWSCAPHLADCETVTGRHPAPRIERGLLVQPIIFEPVAAARPGGPT